MSEQPVASTDQSQDASHLDQAVAEGGAYEIIRKRLTETGKNVFDQVTQLNEQRLDEFGHSDLEVTARVRLRTENNCIARDIVQVGDKLLFGYNVFIGLKKTTRVNDVFALFTLESHDNNAELHPVSGDESFLSDVRFQKDFSELYQYYKKTRLVEITLKNGKLLMGFQISERLEDLRVFRWEVSPDGAEVTYIDNRGERDIQLPARYDFEWQACTREDTVQGRHPHVNILDTIFVDTLSGQLTIKVENNTETGLGIYQESVEDKTQSIDDADYGYVALGDLILLRIKPYRETLWRYFIFNTLTQTIVRNDALGESCVQLPEDHGIVFPGGCYLQSGEYKTFDESVKGLRIKRSIRSPNGEDVLFVFYEPEAGLAILLSYNLINKSLKNPIVGHGYAIFSDGSLIVFSAEDEPTRIHPMQIWTTPFVSDEFASQQPARQTELGRIGNPELVRGISDIFSVSRLIDQQSVSARIYEELGRAALKIFDDHYWVEDYAEGKVAKSIHDIVANAELAIDEFEKVQAIQRQSRQALEAAESDHEKLLHSLRFETWDTTALYVEALHNLRLQRGQLATLKTMRYMDVAHVESLEAVLEKEQTALYEKTANFLVDEKALAPYDEKVLHFNTALESVEKNADLKPVLEGIEQAVADLNLLSELLSSLKIDDATQRTAIIDSVSSVYSRLNQCRANAKHKEKSLGAEEAVAQFSAQFKLFSQSITHSLSLATSPEACDEQMSHLLVQLEELETQFSQHETFLADILTKRDEVYETFEAHKQQLLDERQRKAHSLVEACLRIVKNIERRSSKFTSVEELNTYFASDPLVLKVRELVDHLRDLDAAVQADDVTSQFKSAKDQALRALRDKSDIFEDGGKVIKLGPRHKFSVNTQSLDLTILPRDNALALHLTGTDYFETLNDPALTALSSYWSMSSKSETTEVYRGEYLAYSLWMAATQQTDNLTEQALRSALKDDVTALKLVQSFIAPRYKEGYEKGIHDVDAIHILQQVMPVAESAELLIFDPLCRGLAQFFWLHRHSIWQNRPMDAELDSTRFDKKRHASITSTESLWRERARAAQLLQESLGSSAGFDQLREAILADVEPFLQRLAMGADEGKSRQYAERVSDYLAKELSVVKGSIQGGLTFVTSQSALDLVAALKRSMPSDVLAQLRSTLSQLASQPAEQWACVCSWLSAFVASHSANADIQRMARYLPESSACLLLDEDIERRVSDISLDLSITQLMGDHARINNRTLHLSLDEFLNRLSWHESVVVPQYEQYLALRSQTIEHQRQDLKLHEFQARPLSSFVRNRLINESYLPLIGDNLAKQMGTIGDNRRTDLMGLLMMISPPGYGKTTLMEYVANRLGLIFMKINCPSLGHDVASLDPEQAPNSTARQELNKINLSFEMGNNVMLYLDDIQHTHPEFLQKFISLCDGSRRIEGVWQKQTKTYDLRGKKFCVVMAGNPYTESGEVFKIPDMLANRADIYNLGDILGGMEEPFALSYIENSLTSNPVLAPLATRDIQDVYRLIAIAQGKDVPTSELAYGYSGAEIKEITDIFKKLFMVRDVVLKINQQYIASAAQADKYRTEPPFKLQGSYRNMNKMCEKISSVMNDSEVMQLIHDHYLGEAQLLTVGAEENLLKLAELRGNLTDTQEQRWKSIKADFMKAKALGGDDTDGASKITSQLVDIVGHLNSLVKGVDNVGRMTQTEKNQQHASDKHERERQNRYLIAALEKVRATVKEHQAQVTVVNEPVPGMDKILRVLAATIEESIFPLVRSMDKKLDIDLRTHEKMMEVSSQLRGLEKTFQSR